MGVFITIFLTMSFQLGLCMFCFLKKMHNNESAQHQIHVTISI